MSDEKLLPCAGYSYSHMKRVDKEDGTHTWETVYTNLVGFSAVGPGWHPVLERLDQRFLEILGPEKVYEFKIGQIKEKFGGLRVYPDNFLERDNPHYQDLMAAITEAERECSTRCEQCGTTENVTTDVSGGGQYGRVKTLCQEHHQQRVEESKQRNRRNIGMPG